MNVRTHTTKPGDIEQVAANWIVRRDAGLNPDEAQELARWRAADPRHDEAMARKENAWTTLGRPLGTGQADVLLERLAARATRRRRRRVLGVAAGIAIFSLSLVSVQRLSSPAVVAKGEVLLPETRTLPDGSVAELRAGAALAVDFDASRRLVRLTRGTAHFQVTHNSARPFVVVAGGVEFRAVGTAFSVELGRERVELLVTEGSVAVGKFTTPAAVSAPNPVAAGGPAQTLAQVDAGRRFIVDLTAPPTVAPAPAAVSPAEMSDRLAWRVPRLEFSELPLAQAVQLINRYNRVQFAIPDADVSQLRVSGVFRADNLEPFVRLLEATCGIQAERSGDVIVLKKAAR